MIKGKELIGLPVVALSNGEKIDSVTDLVLDYEGNQLLALLTDKGGWFSDARALNFGDIKTIGENTVIVDSPDLITTSHPDGKLKTLLSNKIELNGKTLLTENGRDLGKISDVYFDERSGRVVGYEATGGIFSDLTQGRTFVPRPAHIKIGEDTAIVSDEVALAMQAQESGGIKGAWASATDSVKGAYENAKEVAQDKLATLETATSAQQKEFVVGKIASRAVTTDAGEVIVGAGETITQQHAEHAELAGMLWSLSVSATGGSISDAYKSAKDATQARLDELKGASVDKQKKFVVGKQAASDVTADDGEVIVRKDEAITQPIADQAEQRGKLGALMAAAAGGMVGAHVQNLREGHHGQDAATAIGKRLRHDVRDEGGYIIGAQGQIVTQEVAEEAEHKGQSDALLAAVGLADDDDTAVEKAGQTAAGARAALASGMSSVSESASSMMDKAKEWIGERSDDVKNRVREERTKKALGRPVTRVVLAPDDTIILNVGELVTNKAVEMARDAGVLDILITSVDTSGASVDSMDGRPDEAGKASLSQGAGRDS